MACWALQQTGDRAVTTNIVEQLSSRAGTTLGAAVPQHPDDGLGIAGLWFEAEQDQRAAGQGIVASNKASDLEQTKGIAVPTADAYESRRSASSSSGVAYGTTVVSYAAWPLSNISSRR
jgi:hypothetical protein